MALGGFCKGFTRLLDGTYGALPVYVTLLAGVVGRLEVGGFKVAAVRIRNLCA